MTLLLIASASLIDRTRGSKAQRHGRCVWRTQRGFQASWSHHIVCRSHQVRSLPLTRLISPKPGDSTTDQVRLRGDSKLVNAIKAEIEKQVKVLKETIVMGVLVPASQHATKIGRGGSALQDLQRKTNTT